METGDSLIAGSMPETSESGFSADRLQPQVEDGEQKSKQIVIKEGFAEPWSEEPATFDPVQAGWEQAAQNLAAKIQEMLASSEVTLTSDGLTPAQAAAKEQMELVAGADARAAKLAEDLAAARTSVDQAASGMPPSPVSDEAPAAPAGTEIDQLVEAPAAPAPGPSAPPISEVGSPLDQLLEQVPAEMRKEIEQRLAEFGEGFDEDEFSKEHQEEYAFINQVISESGDPTKTVEAAGRVKAYLDSLDGQEDGDKKKKDFLVNLFGIYKRRFDQETDPGKKEEVKKSMLGLRQELGGLGIGALGGLLDVMVGAIVGELQEQLK